MITMLCTKVAVAVCINASCIGLWSSEAQMEGTYITENSEKLLIDFSKEALKKGYHGDYSRVFVPRGNCVKVGG